MMKGLSRNIAALLACLFLTASISISNFRDVQNAAAEVMSLSAFVQQISVLSASASACQPFCTLRYSETEQILYRDEEPVGTEFGDFRILDGKLMQKIDSKGASYIPAEEAAEINGCSLQKNSKGITVQSPFQKARLIIKTESVPNLHGALETVSGYGGLHVMQYASPAQAYLAYQAYMDDPSVEFVDTDCVFHITETPAANSYDPVDVSWGISAIGADQYCKWLCETKEILPDIRVAVIDTGVYTDHLWMKNRIADGGAGFVTASDGSFEDRHGHGTHCAGIIVSATADNVRIVPLKAMDDDGYGESLEIFCAMMYALEIGADVVNMSLGGDGESPLLEEAAKALEKADIPVCVSAGNECNDLQYHHPADIESCIVIGAVNKKKQIADFSNFGETIDFVAPGVSINSASAASPEATDFMDGTSMAAPFVSAAIADILSFQPDLTNETILAYLKSNAIDLGEPGFDRIHGWGLISLSDFRFSEKYCPMPDASLLGGSYTNAINVSLSCSDPDAEIYYTLDGTKPDPLTSSHYFVPLYIVSSAELRAIAVKNGLQSRELCLIYFIGTDDLPKGYTVEQGVLKSYHGRAKELHLDELFPDGTLTAIGEGAFSNNEIISSVTLPDSVAVIGDRAFDDCPALSSISGKGIKKIGSYAFRNCCCLQMLTVSDSGLTELGKGAFFQCKDLNNINGLLDSNMNEIPPHSFYGCVSLSKLDLNHVSVFGNYAFANCKSLQDFGNIFRWQKVLSIGDSALSGTLISGKISLDSLEYAGKDAFRSTKITELVLPEYIKQIPEGFASHTETLYAVTAPGVKIIGAYAFSRSVSSSLSVYMNYAAITEIGRSAFQNVYFPAPISFDNLAEISQDAFSGTSGCSISFPSVKTLRKNSLQNSSVPVLYFENCETVEEHALNGSCGVVFGSNVRQVMSTAFEVSFLAAPKGSEIEHYAETHRIDFYQTPSLFASEHELTVIQGKPAILHAFSLGTDEMELHWYNTDGNYYEELDALNSSMLSVNTLETGTFHYRAELTENGLLVSSSDYTVSVLSDSEYSVLPELPCNETVLISWGDQCTNSDDQIKAEHLFRAQKAEKMTLYLSNAVCYVTVAGTDGTFLQFNDFDTSNPAEPVLGDSSYSIPVLKGMDYRITLTLSDECINHCSELYSTILLSEQENLNCLSDGQFRCGLKEEDSFVYSGKAVIPHLLNPVFETEQGSTSLTEGSLLLVYTNNTTPGTGRIHVFGTGNYWGHQTVPFSITGIIQSEQEALTENIAPGESCLFTYTPKESGEYCVYVDYPEEAVTHEILSGAYSASFWECSISLSVKSNESFESSLKTINSNSCNASSLPAVTADLIKDVTYQFVLTNNGCTPAKALCLKVEKEKQAINDHFISLDIASPLVTKGRSAAPEISFISDQELIPGQDYTANYYFNDHAGTMLILIRGAGEYRGCTVLTKLLYGVIQENEEKELNSNQLQNGFFYQFTPQNSGNYLIFADFSTSSLNIEMKSGVYHDAFYDTPELPLILTDSNENEMSHCTSARVFLSCGLPLISAELEANSTYYIGVKKENLPTVIRSISLMIRYQAKHIAQAVSDSPESYSFSGNPISPTLTLFYDDYSLTEGKDYSVNPYADTSVGTMGIIVSGIGEYCGRTYLTAEIKNSNQNENITINNPFTFDHLSGTFSFELNKEAALNLSTVDGLDIDYRAYITRNTDQHILYFDNGELMLDAGKYELHLLQDVAFSRIFLLKPIVFGYEEPISACDFHVVPVFADGTPKQPVITANYKGSTLTEGSDYVASLYSEMIDAGVYPITICGRGRFSGEMQICFCILPQSADTLPILTEGESIAQIKKPAETVFYRWIPDQETYCFSSTCQRHKTIRIIDPLTGLSAQLTGIGDQFSECAVIQDKEYYVACSFLSSGDIGTIPFRISSDYRILSECTAVHHNMIPQQKGDTVPEFEIYDQDMLLEKGIDYVVNYIGGQTHCGKAEISLKGIGRYYGDLLCDYYIYPTDPDAYILENCEGRTETLECGVPETLVAEHPGYTKSFLFTAPYGSAKSYYIDYPEADFTSFVFDPDGNIMPIDQHSFTVEGDKSLRVLCIASWLELDHDFGQEYSISVEIDQSCYDPSTGFSYRQTQNKIWITDYDNIGSDGLHPQTLFFEQYFSNPDTGHIYDFAGFSPSYKGIINTDVTVYCEPGSDFESVFKQSGWCVAYPEFAFQQLGDVTGDGLVNLDDAKTLLRCLTEGHGILMCSAACQAADYNQDGLINLQDVQAILFYIQSNMIG